MSAALRHQRAEGAARIVFRRRGDATVLADLRQDGCLKARFPRPVGWTEAVLLNSSGGVAAGDTLRVEIAAGPGARATVSSQAAERFYRALPDSAPSLVRNSVTLEPGACVEWLPQESILFDRCAIDRQMVVTMPHDATFLGVEALVFGRTAMGETVVQGRVADTIRVLRDGRPVLHDALRLSGDIAATLARPAIAAGAAAIATLVYVAGDAEAQLDALRAAVEGVAAECGASAWNGMLVARCLARDGAALRAAILAGLAPLRAGRMLPRVWGC